VAPLQYTDTALATGPPFLALLEPALSLFALTLGALGGAIRNAHPLDTPVVRGRFVFGRVEGSVARQKTGNAAQPFLMYVAAGDH